jgi:hypothetical protein
VILISEAVEKKRSRCQSFLFKPNPKEIVKPMASNAILTYRAHPLEGKTENN